MTQSMHGPAADVLAAAVVELRKAAGMSQRDLAAALDREQNLVARIETGQRRLDLIDWVSICQACRVDAEAEVLKLLKKILPLVPKK
jgi:transcriptional regulator with XRE-family HTH domain